MRVKRIFNKKHTLFIVFLVFFSLLNVCLVKGVTRTDHIINAGLYYQVTYANLQQGWQMKVTYNVKSGNSINIYVLNNASYSNYKNSQSFTYEVVYNNVIQGEFIFEVPSEDIWVVLFDNKDSSTSVTLDLSVEAQIPNPYFWVQILIIIIVIVAPVVIVIVFIIKKKRK